MAIKFSPWVENDVSQLSPYKMKSEDSGIPSTSPTYIVHSSPFDVVFFQLTLM